MDILVLIIGVAVFTAAICGVQTERPSKRPHMKINAMPTARNFWEMTK